MRHPYRWPWPRSRSHGRDLGVGSFSWRGPANPVAPWLNHHKAPFEFILTMLCKEASQFLMDALDTLRGNSQQDHPAIGVRFEKHQGTKPFISGEKEAIFGNAPVQGVLDPLHGSSPPL